jgi:hypothetical protein
MSAHPAGTPEITVVERGPPAARIGAQVHLSADLNQ